MNRKELIRKYIEFFKTKGHAEIPNSSLVPENDPNVLFTTAGMHPIIPFLLGQPHPLGKRLTNVQRCIRTQDIEEVGDTYHHTFFEMLGNWSLGDYWKKEAISYTFEFFNKVLGMPIEKLGVSCFKGDETAPRDEESAQIWKSLGIPEERIAFLPKENNWWEIPGEGPCGPDTELFYYKLDNPPLKFDPEDENWVEIGNNVLMEFEKDSQGNYKPAKQKNIDFGGGVERVLALINGLDDDYLTDAFYPIIQELERLSGKKYETEETKRVMRVIADHIKASTFIIADGVSPSNVERGYVLRRLIRRAVRYGRKIGIENFTPRIAKIVIEIYDDYPHLKTNELSILKELELEEKKFLKTLEKGMKIFEKMTKDKEELNGKDAFLLYQSYGFPLEITKELAQEKDLRVNEEEFKKEQLKHQELSRTATKGKFKSGLIDKSPEATRLHTATHLLHAALRKVLGEKVRQRGSVITKEKLRFDFSFDRKLTEEEIRKVEDMVNEAIKKALPVKREEMSLEEAKKSGALGFFEDKYGERVIVYTIGDDGEVFSKEMCAGPHVSNTGELGRFKIIKEESSGAGVRRIKAILLPDEN